VTDALAVYAAVVATAGGGWQVYSWWRDRGVRVRLDASYGVGVGGASDLIFITLTNDSSFPVRWTQAGLNLQDGSKQFALVGLGGWVSSGYELPATVPSRDSHQTAVPADEVVGWGIDLYRPIVAQARVGTGQVVKSKPKTLLSR
jgi:hypothetical protein